MTIKRVSWLLTLALTATIVGLILAPQALLLALLICETLPPSLAGSAVQQNVILLASYDGTLLGVGFLLWLASQRLGWLRGHSSAFFVTASPLLAEILLLRATGFAASMSAVGLAVRAILAISALAAVWLSVRRLDSPN